MILVFVETTVKSESFASAGYYTQIRRKTDTTPRTAGFRAGIRSSDERTGLKINGGRSPHLAGHAPVERMTPVQTALLTRSLPEHPGSILRPARVDPDFSPRSAAAAQAAESPGCTRPAP